MRTRKADFQFIDHSGALHGFTEPRWFLLGTELFCGQKWNKNCRRRQNGRANGGLSQEGSEEIVDDG